ncbi:MAG: hypothetical protein V2A62_02205 [Candidatus Woesearchaeota archaeon]
METSNLNSSYLTLERIAQADRVDDTFRRRMLNKKIWKGIGAVTAGGVLGLIGAYLTDGDAGAAITGAVMEGFGILSALGGIGLTIKPARVLHAYNKEIHSATPLKEIPYFVEGRVSLLETVVEKAYGTKIKPVTSLINLPPATAEEGYLFVDHLKIEEISSGKVSLSIRALRKGEEVVLYYYHEGRPSKELCKRLYAREKEEIALVFKAKKEDSKKYLLEKVVKVYLPHP